MTAGHWEPGLSLKKSDWIVQVEVAPPPVKAGASADTTWSHCEYALNRNCHPEEGRAGTAF